MGYAIAFECRNIGMDWYMVIIKRNASHSFAGYAREVKVLPKCMTSCDMINEEPNRLEAAN